MVHLFGNITNEWKPLLVFPASTNTTGVLFVLSWANNLIFSVKLFSLKRSCECFYWKKRMKTTTHHLPVLITYRKGKASSFFPPEFHKSSEIPTAKDEIEGLISFFNFSDQNSDTICLFDRNSNLKTSDLSTWASVWFFQWNCFH